MAESRKQSGNNERFYVVRVYGAWLRVDIVCVSIFRRIHAFTDALTVPTGKQEALLFLTLLTERNGMRCRNHRMYCNIISHIRYHENTHIVSHCTLATMLLYIYGFAARRAKLFDFGVILLLQLQRMVLFISNTYTSFVHCYSWCTSGTPTSRFVHAAGTHGTLHPSTTYVAISTPTNQSVKTKKYCFRRKIKRTCEWWWMVVNASSAPHHRIGTHVRSLVGHVPGKVKTCNFPEITQTDAHG